MNAAERRIMQQALDALGRIGCQFWACPGPDKPFRSMRTCLACDTIRKLRKALGNDLKGSKP